MHDAMYFYREFTHIISCKNVISQLVFFIISSRAAIAKVLTRISRCEIFAGYYYSIRVYISLILCEHADDYSS